MLNDTRSSPFPFSLPFFFFFLQLLFQGHRDALEKLNKHRRRLCSSARQPSPPPLSYVLSYWAESARIREDVNEAHGDRLFVDTLFLFPPPLFFFFLFLFAAIGGNCEGRLEGQHMDRRRPSFFSFIFPLSRGWGLDSRDGRQRHFYPELSSPPFFSPSLMRRAGSPRK